MQNALISSAVTSSPVRLMIHAHSSSPYFSSGTPITATADAYGDEAFNGQIALIDTRVQREAPAGHHHDRGEPAAGTTVPQ